MTPQELKNSILQLAIQGKLVEQHPEEGTAAELYKQMIEEKFHPKAVFINGVHPACGINVGPGLMAAYYMGKPISKELNVERAIIESLSKGE
jgi:fatty acid-binding protein DegV